MLTNYDYKGMAKSTIDKAKNHDYQGTYNKVVTHNYKETAGQLHEKIKKQYSENLTKY